MNIFSCRTESKQLKFITQLIAIIMSVMIFEQTEGTNYDLVLNENNQNFQISKYRFIIFIRESLMLRSKSKKLPRSKKKKKPPKREKFISLKR